MDDDTPESITLPFLAHLGLDEQADERAIRKAYAQRLKRIDQVHEPQAFQTLREAYETALRWSAWQRQRAVEQAAEEQQAVESARVPAPTLTVAEPVDVTPIDPTAQPSDALPDTAPVPTRPDADGSGAVFEAPPEPEVLAETVFGGFVAQCDQGFASEDEAQKALDQALADERLVNLEARALFEWRVACLLAEGWRPGHEFLFGPACKTFQWEQERRALAMFGRVGAVLDAAIRERLMFFGLGPMEFNAHRQLIQRLRRDTMPEASELLRSVPTLRMLAQRYPQWLRMITSQANFVRWNEAFEAIPVGTQEAHRQWSGERKAAAAPPARPPAGRQAPKRTSSFSLWGLGIALFVVIRLLSGLSQDSSGKFHFSTSSSSRPLPAAAPASTGGFVPLFDLSPTAPVAPRPGEGDLAKPFTATPTTGSAGSPLPPPDRQEERAHLDRRQNEVEALLKKLQAEPLVDLRSDGANVTRRADQPAGADSPAPSSGGETQRRTLPVAGAGLGELGSSLLSPDTGVAPKLSYELDKPADAASAPPSWVRPERKL